nr:hypothetical protein [Kibdelosporangium sp. MJ126-NF4]
MNIAVHDRLVGITDPTTGPADHLTGQILLSRPRRDVRNDDAPLYDFSN